MRHSDDAPYYHDALAREEPMITLFGFEPAFGLPSPGPFDLKTEMQLQMMGLEYRKVCDGRANAPKGKLPYIDDGGTLVADSTFIRVYLERKYSKDLDSNLNEGQRAVAWAMERLVEDSLYWAMVHARWAVDSNFAKGPAHFFDNLPDEIHDDARQKQRTAVLGYLLAQGFGRHSADEIAVLAQRGYSALATFLGGKRYLMGDCPCGGDATVVAQIASALSPWFDSPVRDAVVVHSNLVEYSARMMAAHFPNLG
jgi:glutathione S-transferase